MGQNQLISHSQTQRYPINCIGAWLNNAQVYKGHVMLNRSMTKQYAVSLASLSKVDFLDSSAC